MEVKIKVKTNSKVTQIWVGKANSRVTLTLVVKANSKVTLIWEAIWVVTWVVKVVEWATVKEETWQVGTWEDMVEDNNNFTVEETWEEETWEVGIWEVEIWEVEINTEQAVGICNSKERRSYKKWI